jgi:glucosyl-dolichyl phosphate glucuronosyltransferase
LIGLIDDDEQVDANWFNCIHSAFQDPAVDFIGGRCLPPSDAQLPGWLPRDFLAVIGWADPGDSIRRYGDPDFNAVLMGGNAVIRRSAFARTGLYSTNVNRTDKRLISGEDEDMYKRLIAAGFQGIYCPSLIIYHHLFPERLTKRYFRRWAFWQGVSLAVQSRSHREPCPHVVGIPRWVFRETLAGGASALTAPFHGRAHEAFSGQLKAIRLAGRLFGKIRY